MHWRIRIFLLPALLFSTMAAAAVSAEEAARLGDSLTPIGAERAGLKNGPHGLSIPPWEGGMSEPTDEKILEKVENPFADEKPLFVITAKNAADYADILTEGQKALLAQFPDSYRMPVYPSHRTAAFSDFVYENTVANATRVTLNPDGHAFKGSIHGFPFPLPQNGKELMWNHIGRYRTAGFRGFTNSAVTTANGDYVIERDYIEVVFSYNNPDVTLETFDDKLLYIFTKTVEPPNKAGESNLVIVPLDRVKDETLVWTYNVGTRKVRRIGRVGYDNPYNDGLMTHDQIDMFNGPMDRYQWKIVGKRPMLVSYNNNAIISEKLKYKDILHKGHVNPDLLRYELHRVWVVEATRLPDVSHIYKRRIFYIDEDSWLILAQDIYDDRDQFWRTGESFFNQVPQIPLPFNSTQVHYDLQSRRYAMLNLRNEEKTLIEYDFTEPESYFTTSKLKRFAEKRHR